MIPALNNQSQGYGQQLQLSEDSFKELKFLLDKNPAYLKNKINGFTQYFEVF